MVGTLDITALLAAPEKISPDDAPALRDLIRKYPYFQPLRLLLAKPDAASCIFPNDSNRLMVDPYSRITDVILRQIETTDLNEIIAEITEDLKEELLEKHATIEANQLCYADIIPFQFRQLMHNLIGNSLKFSNPTKPPHIRIKCEIANGIK
ncbi:MAG: hypothetical protein EOO89_30480, partial [Pedobacter sp.]